MPNIHSTAIVDPGAEIADSVEIGPYCIIGPNVKIGENVKLHAFVYLTGNTNIGEGCVCMPNVTLGGGAQVLGHKEDGMGQLVIGKRNVFRENVTVHGASPHLAEPTRIGDDCFFMVGTHVAHDCQIGNKCVLANLASIGGECRVGDQVWFGGGSIIHQKTWIGDHTFVGGGSILVGDVIPFASTQGNHAHIAAINVVGLKRRGFSKSEIREIYAAYKTLDNDGGTFQQRLEQLEALSKESKIAASILEFVRNPRSGRALCQFRSGK